MSEVNGRLRSMSEVNGRLMTSLRGCIHLYHKQMEMLVKCWPTVCAKIMPELVQCMVLYHKPISRRRWPDISLVFAQN